MMQRATLERCLFGLMRLEAHAVITKKIKTVCITLPGQATTAPLLPMLHKVFPCERHLFIYDGCTNVVGRTLANRKSFDVSATIGTASLRCFTSSIRHSTPLRRTLAKQIPVLAGALQQLPLNHADTVECWMTSVDAMLQRKEDTVKDGNEEYLPFVCKLPLLLSTGTATERQLALLNLLQFVTGSRSRSLPDGAYQQAEQVILNKYYASMASTPKPATAFLNKAMEDCVFRHKNILLGDKTLIDTVLPRKEWSLKAAKKISGCACCGPEDDEDEDEYNPSMTSKDQIQDKDEDSSSNNPMTAALLPDDGDSKKPSTYVDGKMGFAFDPSKFG